MASSPTEPGLSTASPRAFALGELIACWNQGYEALARGDLDGVAALIDLADESLAQMTSGPDTPEEAALRGQALSARGRLEHGMRAGLQGLSTELATTRRGTKALRGYGDATRALGGRLEKRV